MASKMRFSQPFNAEGKKILAVNTIRDNPGARKKKIRIGRGQGSGRGGSATRGQRGQKSRENLGKRVFEGGQTPISRRVPKRGFKNPTKEILEGVSLAKVIDWVKKGRLDASKVITIHDLYHSGCCGKPVHGVKLLASGMEEAPELTLNFEVSHVSQRAKDLVEAKGGSVKLKYYNRVGLRAHLYPHKFKVLPRTSGTPPPKKAWRYATQADASVQLPYRPFFPDPVPGVVTKPHKRLTLEQAAEEPRRRALALERLRQHLLAREQRQLRIAQERRNQAVAYAATQAGSQAAHAPTS